MNAEADGPQHQTIYNRQHPSWNAMRDRSPTRQDGASITITTNERLIKWRRRIKNDASTPDKQ